MSLKKSLHVSYRITTLVTWADKGREGGHKIGKMGRRRLWMAPYKKMKYPLQKVKYLFQKVIGSDTYEMICTASITFKIGICGSPSKGQLISKGLFDVIVSTEKPTNFLKGFCPSL